VQHRHHGQTADQFGDEPELHQVIRLCHRQDVPEVAVLFRMNGGGEADPAFARPPLDDLVQTFEGAAADEQDVARIDVDEVLFGMFASALGGDGRHRAFEQLEQALLHAFARDVSRDGRIRALAGDLVHFVDVHDAALRRIDVVVGGLQQAYDDVFHVFAHVAGLGQDGGVHDGEGHVQVLGDG